MSKKYSFTIPGKPYSDTRPRAVHRGRVIYDPRSKEKKEIKKILKKLVAETDYAMPKKYDSSKDTRQKRVHDVQYLKVEIETYAKAPKHFSKYIMKLVDDKLVRPGGRPDTDNYIKLYMDACHDILYEDDSIVVDVTGRKFYTNNDEHVIITVEFINIPKD